MLIIYMCRAASTVVILRIFIMLFLVSMMIEIVENREVPDRYVPYNVFFKIACILHVVLN